MSVYAGIGSRAAPSDVLAEMTRIAVRLRDHGWRLRSGHAPGCDQAFEAGAGEDADVFLPWPGFEARIACAARVYDRPSPQAAMMASRFHPGWMSLSRPVRALHARNMHQVLGWELDRPAALVICWTANGSITGAEPDTGGTGQALRCAVAHDVEVVNLARPGARARIRQLLS